jgi:hypothetical protein
MKKTDKKIDRENIYGPNCWTLNTTYSVEDSRHRRRADRENIRVQHPTGIGSSTINSLCNRRYTRARMGAGPTWRRR